MTEDTTQIPQVKFDKKFRIDIDTYIEDCKKKKETPSVAGFGLLIGVSQDTIWQWANKKKKDDKGNLTNDNARPNFLAKVKELDSLSKKTDNNELNLKQELFCQLYASDREFFGNGVDSYDEAYDVDHSKPNWYKVAQAAASRLLSNVIVLKRINEILELHGLNDTFVDKQLEFIITQNADFSSKVAAIREYNKLRQRITEKIDHTTKGKELPTPILLGGSNVPVNDSTP